MNDLSALRVAVDLMHFPWQARRLSTGPLPADTQLLLRIAAGDEQAIGQATEATGRSRQLVCEAAVFFIEQVLLHPDADSYRVLGAKPEAGGPELRRNVALLLRWLHPDLNRQGERAVFVARVTGAWNDLKTQERREAYDRLRNRSSTDKLLRRKKGNDAWAGAKKQHRHRRAFPRGRNAQHRISRQTPHLSGYVRGGFLRRVILFLFGRAVH